MASRVDQIQLDSKRAHFKLLRNLNTVQDFATAEKKSHCISVKNVAFSRFNRELAWLMQCPLPEGLMS